VFGRGDVVRYDDFLFSSCLVFFLGWFMGMRASNFIAGMGMAYGVRKEYEYQIRYVCESGI
jgi:hypothetical protein